MSLNKVILIGNVGKDPDVRYFPAGNLGTWVYVGKWNGGSGAYGVA